MKQSEGGLVLLQKYLQALEPGPIEDPDALAIVLAGGWSALSGSDAGGMMAYKLLGRIEQAEWNPPNLSFKIERHGGAARGSTRAEIQNWRVDIDKREVLLGASEARQLRPTAPRLDLVPLVKRVAEQVILGAKVPELAWLPSGSVRVQIGQILPRGSEAAQTRTSRRKRFWKLLEAALSAGGWVPLKVGTFIRASALSPPARGPEP